MPTVETIRRVTVQARQEGVTQVTAQLHGLSQAQDEIARSAANTATVTDISSRRQLSAARAYDRIHASLDATAKAQMQFARQQRVLDQALNGGAIGVEDYNRVLGLARKRFEDLVPDSTPKKIGLASHEMKNLGFQLNDAVTMLASGSSPFQVMATQGGQVYQILAGGEGGVKAALRDVAAATVTWIGRLAPLIAVVGMSAAGIGILRSRIKEATGESVGFGDTFRAVFQSIGDGISGLIGDLNDTALAKWFSDQWELVIKGFSTVVNHVARGALYMASVLREAFGSIPDLLKISGEKVGNWLLESSKADMVLSGMDPGDVGKIDLGAAAAAKRIEENARREQQYRAGLAGMNDFDSRWMDSISGHAVKNLHEDDKKKKKGRTRESDYEREIQSLRDRTAAMEADSRAVGLSTFEAAKLTAQMDLENAARKDSIGLTTERRAEIEKESSAYARQAEALEKAREAQQRLDDIRDAYREGMSTFVSTFREGLKAGEGFWASFADAATKAIDQITERLIDLALNSAFDALLGKQGESGGGFLGSVMGSLFGGGAGAPMDIRPTAARTGHTGALIGATGTPRYVHPAYFDDAPRYHTGGLLGDEVPFVGLKGERVLSRAETRAYDAAMRGGGSAGGTKVENHIHNNAAGVKVRTESQEQPDGSLRQDIIIEAISERIGSRIGSGHYDKQMGRYAKPRLARRVSV
jgi:hypothetical protein